MTDRSHRGTIFLEDAEVLGQETWPGDQFILTVRDPDRWIASVVTHFGDAPIASHEFFYDVPTASGHEERYLERFHQHNAEVREYFADRPDDLLVMDIAAGDGWEPLCAFLGVPAPSGEFPRSNAREEFWALCGGEPAAA